jgi:FeS assembly SUF system protein
VDDADPIPYLSGQEWHEDGMTQATSPTEGDPLIRPSSTEHPLYERIVEACRTVYDPEIPVNIYDLGLVYTIAISGENDVEIDMSLTAPGCPVAGEMPGWVADAVEPLEGVRKVDVNIVWDPPWGMDRMSDEARLELGFM